MSQDGSYLFDPRRFWSLVLWMFDVGIWICGAGEWDELRRESRGTSTCSGR